MSSMKKVVLAYSGGLDTSVIVRWLQDTYHSEVVTFTADIGQGEEVEPARAKAEAFRGERRFILTIYVKSSSETSCFLCFEAIPSMKGSTYWGPLLPAR